MAAIHTVMSGKGDSCLLVFAEGALDDWLNGGESEDLRKYDLTDAIAIPGVYNFGIPAIVEYPNDVCLKNGSTMLRIEPSGSVYVDGADLVVDGISFKSHVHSGVESGGSNTGTPVGG